MQRWLAERHQAYETATRPNGQGIAVQGNSTRQKPELDQQHRLALGEILERPTWAIAELRVVTSRLGLLPLACVARLNEWTIDRYGDLLLEGDQVLTVNDNLKTKIQI